MNGSKRNILFIWVFGSFYDQIFHKNLLLIIMFLFQLYSSFYLLYLVMSIPSYLIVFRPEEYCSD